MGAGWEQFPLYRGDLLRVGMSKLRVVDEAVHAGFRHDIAGLVFQQVFRGVFAFLVFFHCSTPDRSAAQRRLSDAGSGA